MTPDLRYRQSRLRGYTECPRRTVLDGEFTAGFVGASAHLGSALHSTVAEILRTLKTHGEIQMATQEAVEVMYEVLAKSAYVLDTEDHDWLRQMVLRFCEFEWDPSLILGVEERLTADVRCPDGKTRTLSGEPDLFIANPGEPPGVVIVDWKSSLGVPRTPREPPEDGKPIVGEEYLHEGGHFQLRVYGFLVMRNYPRVEYATLRQSNPRWGGPPREATIWRAQHMEHAERQIGLIMQQLDTALEAGEDHELSQPRPGAHCTTRCPVARTCPIPREQRGLGVIESPQDAIVEAERRTVMRALGDQMTKSLKAYHEATGQFIPVGDQKLGWHVDATGRRKFELR